MWRIGSSICTFYIYSFWEARKQVNTNITRSRFEKERTKRINKNVCRHHRYHHYLDESWTPQGNIDIFTEGPGGILIPSMEGPGGRLHVGTSGLHIYVVYSKKQYFTEHHGWGNKTVLCKPVEGGLFCYPNHGALWSIVSWNTQHKCEELVLLFVPFIYILFGKQENK